MDGGVSQNTPVADAVRLGADRLYVLPAGYACNLPIPPGGALGMALHTLSLFMQQQLMRDVERYQGEVDLRLIPPLCPLDVSPADFSHSAELIRRGHETTARWLSGAPAAVSSRRRGWGPHRDLPMADSRHAMPLPRSA
jgi:NTE family protein